MSDNTYEIKDNMKGYIKHEISSESRILNRKGKRKMNLKTNTKLTKS